MRKKIVFLLFSAIIFLVLFIIIDKKDNQDSNQNTDQTLDQSTDQSTNQNIGKNIDESNNSEVIFEGQNNQQYRLLIATDLHFLSQSLTDNGEGFTRIIKQGDGKVMLYIEDLVDEFFDQVILQKPDALVLTGDLTFNGEIISNEEMAQKLKIVKDAGIDVFVIPGNHDVYTECYSFSGDSYTETQTTESEEFYKLYADFGYNQAIATDETSASYIVELLPDFWLIMIDTTSQYYNVLLPESIKWLEEKLIYAKENNIRVMTSTHQNLLTHNEMFMSNFLIRNSEEITSLFKKYNVICNFSGHIHIQHIAKEDGFYDIVTGALSVCENNYGEVIIKEKSLSYNVKNVEKYKQQSKDFFYEIDLNKRMYRQDDIELAKIAAKINTEYFAGKLNLMSENLIEDIDKVKSGVSSDYYNTLIDEAERNFDNLNLEIFYSN